MSNKKEKHINNSKTKKDKSKIRIVKKKLKGTSSTKESETKE